MCVPCPHFHVNSCDGELVSRQLQALAALREGMRVPERYLVDRRDLKGTRLKLLCDGPGGPRYR